MTIATTALRSCAQGGASCDRAALRLRMSLLSVSSLVVPIKIVVLLPSCFHFILDSASSSGAVLIVTWRTGLVERSAKVVGARPTQQQLPSANGKQEQSQLKVQENTSVTDKLMSVASTLQERSSMQGP